MNSPSSRPPKNLVVAEVFREAAELLRKQNASPFRVAALLKGGDAVEALEDDIGEVADRGVEALEALPHIGRGLAAAIIEIVQTGRWSQIDRLRGTLEPEALFQTIPGVGPQLARTIQEGLHAETLEAVEVAAHDGRLGTLPGIGPRRASAIRHALAGMLARRRRIPIVDNVEALPEPSVATLLDVDQEYRSKASARELQLIAPKRFNPEGKAWLPILHTERPPWHFTALFSNTARAHELGKTSDWVVIFFSSDHRHEGQCTVVTETSGPRRGQRVVRGRESECELLQHNSGS
jgi:hypothetical protein